MNNSNKKKSNQLGMPNRVYDDNHNGRLSPSKVEEIRELLRVNSRRKVAEITGASKTTIARIARGEIYKYI